MNEIVARHQITQLVAAAELNLAAVHLVEVVEVIRLEHLVGELGQAHAVRALQPGLHAVPTQHGAHPEVPPDLRQEAHHVPVLVPAQVVQYSHGAQLPGAILEIELVVGENPLDALPDAAGVLLRSLRGQTLPLARFPARVSDLRRGSSEHSQDVMAGIPEVQEADESEQIAHMEAVGGGVEAAVNSLRGGLEQPGKLVLSRVLREGFLQNAAFVQRIEESVQ